MMGELSDLSTLVDVSSPKREMPDSSAKEQI
jgi:hypothetical protein